MVQTPSIRSQWINQSYTKWIHPYDTQYTWDDSIETKWTLCWYFPRTSYTFVASDIKVIEHWLTKAGIIIIWCKTTINQSIINMHKFEHFFSEFIYYSIFNRSSSRKSQTFWRTEMLEMHNRENMYDAYSLWTHNNLRGLLQSNSTML
jgi:hypothetical protein